MSGAFCSTSPFVGADAAFVHAEGVGEFVPDGMRHLFSNDLGVSSEDSLHGPLKNGDFVGKPVRKIRAFRPRRAFIQAEKFAARLQTKRLPLLTGRLIFHHESDVAQIPAKGFRDASHSLMNELFKCRSGHAVTRLHEGVRSPTAR